MNDLLNVDYLQDDEEVAIPIKTMPALYSFINLRHDEHDLGECQLWPTQLRVK